MPLVLKIETTTGLLVPGGVAPPIARGPQVTTLQFLTNSNAALLTEGHPVALKLYALDDTVTPIATFNSWERVAAFATYRGTLNPLNVAALGYLPAGTLYGRISYGTPNVDSALFHVRWGGSGEVTGAPITPIVITQPSGPTKQLISLATKTGNVKVENYGNRVVRAAGNVVGLQVYANTAPEGADMLIELRKNGVGTGAVATLSADAKSERTAFAPVIAVAVDDVLDISVTQIGSSKAGGYLNVEAELELT